MPGRRNERMDHVSTTSYNCTNEGQRAEGLAHAQKAIAAKQVIVMPTDTVYGLSLIHI